MKSGELTKDDVCKTAKTLTGNFSSVFSYLHRLNKIISSANQLALIEFNQAHYKINKKSNKYNPSGILTVQRPDEEKNLLVYDSYNATYLSRFIFFSFGSFLLDNESCPYLALLSDDEFDILLKCLLAVSMQDKDLIKDTIYLELTTRQSVALEKTFYRLSCCQNSWLLVPIGIAVTGLAMCFTLFGFAHLPLLAIGLISGFAAFIATVSFVSACAFLYEKFSVLPEQKKT